MAGLLTEITHNPDVMEYMNTVAGISLQLHITAQCDQACKHCYMYNSPFYKNQLLNPMGVETWCALIREYYALIKEYSTYGLVAITGGDPMLSPILFELLDYIRNHCEGRVQVIVLGNSYHITKESAEKLKKAEVSAYQISLDGLEETHDQFRKKGSFKDSIRALRLLHEAEIEAAVSFTVSRKNKDDLIPLWDYLSRLDFVDSIGYDRLIPTGNGVNLKEDIPTPSEYREFLAKLFVHEIIQKPRLQMVKGDMMWRPFLHDIGLLDPIPPSRRKPFSSGCACGTGTASFLADGTYLPCRKIELSGGKYPEQSLRELLVGNALTKKIRERKGLQGCGSCEINHICRGCPAMKYAVTGSFKGVDACCWKAKAAEEVAG